MTTQTPRPLQSSVSLRWRLSGFADEAGNPLDTQIKTIHAAGLSTIDLRNLEGHNISALPVDLAQSVAAKLKAANIEVGMLGSPIGKIDISEDFAIDQAKLRHLATMADLFRCRLVRIFSYFNRNNADEATWQKVATDRLGQLRSLAQSLGLVLYLENENGIYGSTIQRVANLVRDLHDSKSFRMLFDFDNYNHMGENVWDAYVLLRDKIDGFHFKDSDAKGQHVPIGQGSSHAREILADAVSRGWSGHLALEPHLAHSAAVMATGPSGQANQALANLSEFDAWQVGAAEARKLLTQLGVVVH